MNEEASSASEKGVSKSEAHLKIAQPIKIKDDDDLEDDDDPLAKAKKPNKVIIKLQCRDLLDLDLVSKSDPFAVFYLKAEMDKVWRRIGRTETIMDNLDPQWDTEFKINYYFEKNQKYKVEVYDSEANGDHELLGTFEEAMNKLLTNSKKYVKGELKKPNKNKKSNKKSMIIVYAEAVGESNVEIKMQA